MANGATSGSMNSKHRFERPRVLSAFTGLGGLDLGLECAGFRTVACIEFDSTARKSISLNRPGWNLLDTRDIVDLARHFCPGSLGLRIRELEILAGGPPCQPFSKAAQWSPRSRRGLDDPRSNALEAFLDLWESLLPKVVLIENVQGFVSGPASALSLVEARINKINRANGTEYSLNTRLLNAADFGVPQQRVRAFIVATRDSVDFGWPETSHSTDPLTAWDAIGDLEDTYRPVASGKWSRLLPSIPEGQNYLWHTAGGGGVEIFGRRTRYWSFLLKLSKSAPSWTVSAQPGPATGPFHWDNRPLTVRELLRLQSFPKDWRVAGEAREQVRQIGNATPPLLAETIGRAIGRQAFGLRYSGRPKLAIRRSHIIPRASCVGEVPKDFLRLVREHAAHPGAGKGPRPRAPA